MQPRAATLLRRMPPASRLPRGQAERAARLLQERSLTAGEVLFERGSPADSMYIVLSGSLMVSAPTAGRDDLPLGRVTANEVIGEMGLLEGAPRAATARCEQEALLLAVDRPTWDGLIARDDVLAHWLLERCAEGLARRIQAMMDRIAAAAHDPDSLHSLPAAAPRREIGWLAWILGGARR